MHYLLLSLLPLKWIYSLPFPSMAAANGQFMLFHAQTYHQFHWHQLAKRIIVEDIAIMRMIKSKKLKGMTYLSRGLIRCRMYQNYQDGIQGFSKNMLAGFGNSVLVLIIYLVLVAFIWPFVIVKISLYTFLICIFMILSMRSMISLLSRESIIWNLCLHPIQMYHLILISLLSIYKKATRRNTWKGRNIS